MMWFKMSTFQEYMKRRRTKIVDVEGILIEIVTIFVNFPSISNALLALVLVAHVSFVWEDRYVVAVTTVRLQELCSNQTRNVRRGSRCDDASGKIL